MAVGDTLRQIHVALGCRELNYSSTSSNQFYEPDYGNSSNLNDHL
jgi:hypothetical protein